MIMANATATKPAANTNSNQSQPQNGGQTNYAPKHSVSFWKPKKSNDGAAAIFEFSAARGDRDACFFVRMMPQNGTGNGAKFLSDKAINVKLGLNDVGEMLSVLSGRTAGLGQKNDKGYWSGLYHDSPNGNSVITLNRGNTESPVMFFGLSVKRESSEGRFNISLTPGEQEILRAFLTHYLPQLFVVES